jgi:hypothetical protein
MSDSAGTSAAVRSTELTLGPLLDADSSMGTSWLRVSTALSWAEAHGPCLLTLGTMPYMVRDLPTTDRGCGALRGGHSCLVRVSALTAVLPSAKGETKEESRCELDHVA